jgi:NAD(P)-dependent dehydrogenase (short-subunit alcohol dehydrogenase family)
MAEETSLLGKVIAVTGAGRGIGREIALLCAREGAAVIVNDVGVSVEGTGGDEGPAHSVVAEIVSAGGTAVADTSSVTDPTGATNIVSIAIESFGRLDAVVNNAGIMRDRMFHKMSHTDWSAVIDVNLHGTFNVSKAAAVHFREQGSGSFVHFTSTSGLIGTFGQANYSATKMAVVGLSNSIARDMLRYNVRSNCIAPFAWSRLTASIPVETEADRLRVERLKTMTADKIAPLVGFLCGDGSQNVTGQVFAVRKNEIFIFSQPRPVRSVHTNQGWSIKSIGETAMPALRGSFTPLEHSPQVFNWDPI